ncbi:MAG: Nif11-like leader peptide family RiPP precursor [Methanomicrobiales archaeon]|nr:Nif11-like leader peptide family RiPP precursor [Methanomicrobiales archaeon]
MKLPDLFVKQDSKEGYIMTIESARLFLKKIQTDKDFVALLQNSGDDARREIIGKEGFDFTREELNLVRSEITDVELSTIIGGIGGPLMDGDKKSGGPLKKEAQDGIPWARE